MNNVIVMEQHGEWVVTLPEYPPSQCWSKHDSEFDAVQEANSTAEALGYDGIEVCK